MNKRIKKKLANRLNLKKYDNAPNCDLITDRNIYHKKHIQFIRFLHGDQLFDEDDMIVFQSKPSDEFINYLNKKDQKNDGDQPQRQDDIIVEMFKCIDAMKDTPPENNGLRASLTKDMKMQDD